MATPRTVISLAAAWVLIVTAGCSGETSEQADASASTGESSDAAPAHKIDTTVAQPADGLPLGTVPGTVTLPPEARVAVTSQFPGAAVRIFVIEGQSVRQGQSLALVRAAEPVQIRAGLSRAQSELALAEARARRVQQLADEGVVARARADEAQAQFEQAQASVNESRRLVSLTGSGADGTMTLRAPIAGRVAHVGVETGEPVDPMTAPFIIENGAAYQLDLQLPARLARSVTPGMGIEVRLPVEGGEPLIVSGSILSVAPSIDPVTRSVAAKATIGRSPGLVAGQNVMVMIQGNTSSGGVAVPSNAVARVGGKDQVFVRSGTTFVARPVTVAAEAGGQAVIAEGLKQGEVVAVSSIPELKAMTAE